MGVLNNLLVIVRVIIDKIIDILFGLYHGNVVVKVPPIKNNLVLESATSLALKIKQREVSAAEVVEAFIERCKEVNFYINAIVDDRFNAAILEAKKLDEDLLLGKFSEEYFNNHPFLGVPFTTKESTSSKGLRWTLGLLSRKKIFADEDAEVVRLLKEAGAIQIGVTNVPQLNLWMETYNPIYGTCKNPYNTSRNAGGSSGGEGSIIAACGSPIGIGSDIGGSIRIPSFRCGIFGHKPTTNLISTKGLSYANGDEGRTIATAGPMAKRSEDLLPLLKVLLGDNAKELKVDEKVQIRDIHIFYQTEMKCLFASPIRKEMQEAVLKAAHQLNHATNRKPQEVNFDSKYTILLWSYMMRKEDGDFKLDLTNRKAKVNVPLEFVKYLLGKSDYNLYSLYNMVNLLMLPVNNDWAKKYLENLRNEVLDVLKDNGVLLFPSEPFPASYQYASLVRPYNFSYYSLWNALDFPVTQVPIGTTPEGLPIGIQIVTAPYQDRLSIAIAKELEDAFGGYVNSFG